MSKLYKSGQIGLMLILVTGIVVSLVLSIASRVITDTSLSRQERENKESFALAETGVEQALLSLNQGQSSLQNVPLIDSANIVSGNFDVAESRSFDLYVKEGEAAQIDLSGTPSNIVISWVRDGEDPGGTCTEGSGTVPASIEVSLVNTSNQVSRYYYNAVRCAADLNPTNRFATSSAGSNGFFNSQAISLTGAYIYMRIKPIYNGATINVEGTNLASQLYNIQSFASGADSRSDIQVNRTLDSAGSVFDYALFSNTTIIK